MTKENRINNREQKQFEKLLKEYAFLSIRIFANAWCNQTLADNDIQRHDYLENEIDKLTKEYGYDKELVAKDIHELKIEYLIKKGILYKEK